LLKLWLFPFVWLLAWSLAELLRRFARGTERAALPLIVLSPAVLPSVNLMLDIPALALGLAAVVVFIRAANCRVGTAYHVRGTVGGAHPTRRNPLTQWRLAAAAGLLAGLAMQTKYTMLLVPPVIVWYGLTHRAIRPALVATLVALGAFAGWEGLLIAKYGRS